MLDVSAREPAGGGGGAGREAGRRRRAARPDPGARRDARPRQGLRREPGHEVPRPAAGVARLAADADARAGGMDGPAADGPPRVTSSSAPVDPSLVDVADAWGQAWRPEAREPQPGAGRAVHHCSLASGVVPSAAWRKRTAELVAADDARDMVHGMLDDTMVAAHHQTFRTYQYEGRDYRVWNPALVEANVALVRGAMWAAAAVTEPWVDEILLDIGLHFGTSGTSSNEVRDERLANTAAAALGSRAGTDAIGGARAHEGEDRQPERLEADRQGARGRGRACRDQPVGAARARGADVGPRRRRAAARSRSATTSRSRRSTATTSGSPGARRTGARPRPSRAAHRGPEGRGRARQGAGEGAPQGARPRARPRSRTCSRRTGSGRSREWRSALPRAPAHGLDRPPADLDGGRRRGANDGDPAEGDGSWPRTGPAVDVRQDDRDPALAPHRRRPKPTSPRWRTGLSTRQVRQPFKQAFREVYVLTPAEEETDGYSNRFAGHILRYPQARALMTARRWGSNFLGPVRRRLQRHRQARVQDAMPSGPSSGTTRSSRSSRGYMGSVEHCAPTRCGSSGRAGSTT